MEQAVQHNRQLMVCSCRACKRRRGTNRPTDRSDGIIAYFINMQKREPKGLPNFLAHFKPLLQFLTPSSLWNYHLISLQSISACQNKSYIKGWFVFKVRLSLYFEIALIVIVFYHLLQRVSYLFEKHY